MAFPATYNFNYYRGDTYTFTISPKNADGTEFDLTGYFPQMTITNGTTSQEVTTVQIIDNVIYATLTPSLRTYLVPGTYTYDLEVHTVVSGAIDKVYTLIAGRITVVADITVSEV